MPGRLQPPVVSYADLRRRAGDLLRTHHLEIEAGGSAGLTLYDRDEKIRARLAVTSNGTPVLGLFDRDGKLTWTAH